MTNASERGAGGAEATGQADAAPRVDPGLVVVVLSLLLGIQPITTDVYLPALPGLAADLQASVASTQLTLSVLLFSFGGSQLLLGPTADRFGRRPVLLAGLALYVLGSIGGALAQHVEALIGWRALQGVGVGAAVVCARVMVRDLYQPATGAHVMSRGLTGLGLIALPSPLLGGLLATAFGWRSALLVCALFGAGTLALIALRLPETAPLRNPRALQLGPMLRQWLAIGRHRGFIAWTALTSATYGGLFAYLAGSAFVFIDVLGASKLACGVYIALNSSCYLAGTLWCRRWLLRHGVLGTVRRAAWFSLAGGGTMVALAFAGVHAPWAIFGPQMVYAFGHGMHQPCSQVAVVAPFPAHAGAASALAGFVLAAVAVVVGGWLGLALDGTVYPLVLTIGTLALITAVVAWTLVQRHGELR